jgi:hypothetical protein
VAFRRRNEAGTPNTSSYVSGLWVAALYWKKD